MVENNSNIDNASVGISYNWKSLHINLKFDRLTIDLDSIINGTKSFGNSRHEAQFIHEYVHFIQNFYCNWGSLVFCEFVLAIEKLGASKAVSNFKLTLPLKIEPIKDAKLWNDGVHHFNNFNSLLSTDDDKSIFDKTYNFRATVIINTDDELTLTNGRVIYTISCKTIREHMAELSCLLFNNYSDKEIHHSFVGNDAYCSTSQILDKQPMYWMLFEYFFTNEYEKIAEGLILLCHAALCNATPLKLICRFFMFIHELPKTKKFNNLYLLAKEFLKKSNEVQIVSNVSVLTLQSLQNQINLCLSHIDHDFFRFLFPIFSYLKSNLSTYHSALSFFQNPVALREKSTWIKMINKTGTPIIRYKDKSLVVTSFSNEFIEALTYFFGIVKVFDNLQDSSEYYCPFHSEYNICKAHHKNDDNCINEPLLVKNPLNNGEECLYQNALELLGLADRIEF